MAIILTLFLTTLPARAHAFKTGGHVGITKESLWSDPWVVGGRQLWFSKCAIQRVVDANLSIDGGKAYPWGNFWQAEMHFDNERFFDASDRLINLRNSIIQKLTVEMDGPGAQDQLGHALHTIQDFYAHTNWVEMGEAGIHPGLGLSWIPDPHPDTLNCSTAGQLNFDVKALTSGYFQSVFDICGAPPNKCRHGYDLTCNVPPFTPCCPDGLNKDDETRAGYPIAYAKAFLASQAFVSSILGAPGMVDNVAAAKLLMRHTNCQGDKIIEFRPTPRSRYHAVNGAAGLERTGRDRSTGGTLGGNETAATTGEKWLLYPGACEQIYGGTWTARTSPTADSLDTYAAGSTGPYTRVDHTSEFGELWQIVPGSFATTPDQCQPQKTDAFDRMFFGADAGTKKTIPGQFNSIVSCALPVPINTGSLFGSWSQYLDLPQGSGFVQYVEYRFFKNNSWSDWRNVSPAGGATMGRLKAWTTNGGELAEATQADSVQLRFTLRCRPEFTTDGENCAQLDYGLLYDDFRLEAVAGAPAPVFGIFQGSIAQTTFTAGVMTGLNCSTPPCWPGIRGTDLQNDPDTAIASSAITDNFNSPYGDSIIVVLASGLRQNGMGINWEQGFDEFSGAGMPVAHTNGAFNPAFDKPRMIYRLFDPASKTWSQFDSTAADANAVSISGADTVVINNEYRVDWPPRDKAGEALPFGFTINGIYAYDNLHFLPRGTRLQYYWKVVDINGGTTYQFATDDVALAVEDLPTLPGSSIVATDIIEFDVLPGVYAPGSAGSLLAGRSDTPILNLDGAYTAWTSQYDPVTQALRGLGARADRYRLLQGLGQGNNFGGHELTAAPDLQRGDHSSNYFPNMTEYGIKDSLANWYRIIIQSSHGRASTLDDESDARLLEEWWGADTGPNAGDRCIFTSGDDYFNALLNTPVGEASTRRISYANNVLGVNRASGTWNGTNTIPYPTVEDHFANPAAGPGLLAGYTVPVDGSCPGPNRFDALTKMGGAEYQNAAFYPQSGGVTDVAAVATMAERDVPPDNDRGKTLGYGFSIQSVRKAGISASAPNHSESGVEERMRIMYKFLTSCRGPRSGAPADTAKCWPCPTDANMTGNWAALAGFQTGLYGPLYPIQDPALATGVEENPSEGAPPLVNKLEGNFPNPFNPQTTIKFSAAKAGHVTLRIFNVGGQLVRTITTKAEVGANEVRWNGKRDDGTPIASGVYFYKVRFADGYESAKRMALVK